MSSALKKRFLKWLFLAVLIGIIAYGISQRLKFYPVPYDLSDLYFINVASYLKNEGFQFGIRGPFYQLIATGAIVFFKKFEGIVYLQFAVGLISCLLLLFFYLKCFDFLSVNKKYKNLYYLSGLVLFYLLYCYNEKIAYEFFFRPESISILFESLILVLIFHILKKPKNFFLNLLFFLVNFLFLYINYKFIFFSLFNLLFFLIIISKRGKNKYRNILLYIFIPFLTIYNLNLMVLRLNTGGAKIHINERREFNHRILFWRNIGIIQKELTNDLEDEWFNKFDKRQIQGVFDYYKKTSARKNNYLNSNIMEVDNFLKFNEGQFKIEKKIWDNFYDYYLKKSLIEHPWAYIQKYFYEMWQVYKIDLTKPSFYTDYPIELKEYKENTLNPLVDCVGIENPILLNFYQKVSVETKKSLLIDDKLSSSGLRILGCLYTPILLVFLIISIVERKTKNIFRNLTLMISLYAFLIASVSAATYYLVFNRYLFEIFPFYLVGEFMMIIYIVKFFGTTKDEN